MKGFLKNFFIWSGSDSEENNEAQFDAGKPATFETALAATGLGKFNVLIVLTAIPTCWATLLQTTTMSYVFPAAQCDLELTLEDKGLLNAVTFGGMMMSAFVWGFLFDMYGRRNLLIIGFFLDGMFVILSAISQDVIFLMITKFMGGVMIIGPFAALTPYLSELHVAKYRSRIPMLVGACYATGGIYLPLVASLILPLNYGKNITENFVFHSWSLFLLVNAVPSLVGAALLFYLPESPKFLMSTGRNDKALEVFQRIYSLNSGKPMENYPIKELVEEETKGEGSSFFHKFYSQLKPLFGQYMKLFLLVCLLQIFIITSFNTFRLWLPQLFQAISDYKYNNNGTSTSLCEMMNILRPGNDTQECFVNFENFDVYLNSMMVCFTSLMGYFIAAALVNILGQNKLLAITSFLGGLFSIGIYFSWNSPTATMFMAIFYALCSIATNVTSLIAVNLFPTSIRATTISVAFMFARIFSMIGNIIFPYLINMGCEPPFIMISALVFACSIFTLILPKQNETLK